MSRQNRFIKNMYRVLSLAIIFFVSIFVSESFSQSGHPFLLCKKSDFPALQAKSKTGQWLEIAGKAAQVCKDTKRINIYSDAVQSAAYKIRNFCDAAALLYIIDTANKTKHRDNIITYIKDWTQMRLHADYGSTWLGCVPVGMALFASVLAYDVIYDDVASADREKIDLILDSVAGDFYKGYKEMGGWPNNRWGACGIYYIFKNSAKKTIAIQGYKNEFNALVGSEGVFQGSVGYSHGRFACYSLAKSHFMDVLEFTGEDKNWYSNPKVQAFYRWVYGQSVLPNGYNASFGDTHLIQSDMAPGVFRAWKFGAEAAGLAAWRVKRHGYETIGGLVNYVLMDKPLPEPLAPASKIFNDGGAFFMEANSNDNSLYSALWNIKMDEGHAHKDINAVCLSGYGEYLLRNSGYNGWGSGISTTPSFTWTDIHDRAWVNNVLLIDNADHSSKRGGGISEGFTLAGFDYACGDAGPAIPSALHKRSLVLIHEQDGIKGYSVILDNVVAPKTDSKINIMWHPNSTAVEEVSLNTEYKSSVQPYPITGNKAGVAIFLGTEPADVQLSSGPCATQEQNFAGKYIRANYQVNADKKKQIITIAYPFDASHSKAQIKRIKGNVFDGAQIINNNNSSDFALESDPGTLALNGAASIRAAGVIYRVTSDTCNFFFAQKSYLFNYGTALPKGFKADSLITIYLKGKNGKLISPGTAVTVYYPGISGVLLNGSPLQVTEKGDNRINVFINKGSYDISIITEGASGIEKDSNNDKSDLNLLKQNYPNPFNPSTVIEYTLPSDGKAALKIYDILGRERVTLADRYLTKGEHKTEFNSLNLPGGVYFYSLITPNYRQTRKMILAR